MPTIYTDELLQGKVLPQNDQIYNGLDTCLTVEILGELQTLFNEPPLAYNFERALQGPLLEVMLRGFAVDETERQHALHELRTKLARLKHILDRFADAVWGKPLNPRSHPQLKDFFYGAMRIPEIWISDKGVKKLSFKREVLEKLEVYFHATPIIATILAFREIAKQIEFLETEVDADGRLRTSYNIAGTETFRLSSSASAFGTGTNTQNWEPELRRVLVADRGRKLCVIDLEQAESREVGLLHGTLFGDWTYLNACEGGDLHTATAKLVWPSLPWTGQKSEDRKIAERNFYRHFSYRDMSKRGGHACLTADHEVLTREGWVPISDKPNEILTWIIDDTGVETSLFANVSHWTHTTFNGDLHHFKGNSIDAFMTANHRVPFVTDYRKGRRLRLQEQRADRGPGKYMPLGGGYVGGNTTVPARLIAAFMADGHQKSTNRMEFHFHKERKKERLKHLCQFYNFQFREDIVNNKILIEGNLPKHPGAFQLEWTRDCLLDFLDELKFWDGHISGPNICISSVNKSELEWYQTFGRILGIGGSIDGPYTSGFGSSCYNMRQNNRNWATGASMSWAKYPAKNAEVFCPTVPSTFFYVRRKGKIFVTGNTSYYATAWTISRHLKIPLKVAQSFQDAFFGAFPAFQKWFRWTAQELQTKQTLVTPFGLSRTFFSRPNDDTTLRAAIAHVPQSSTANRTNLALWRIWDRLKGAELLAQTHDSVTFQYAPQDEQEIIPAALKLMSTPFDLGHRVFDVPGEAKVGWNWAPYCCGQKEQRSGKEFCSKNNSQCTLHPNPNGLRKFKPGLLDDRQRLSGLARVI